MTQTQKKTVIQTMTHLEMQSLVKKGFSFDDLSNHPNLIYRRTMTKRRQQLLRMVALLEGTNGATTIHKMKVSP